MSFTLLLIFLSSCLVFTSTILRDPRLLLDAVWTRKTFPARSPKAMPAQFLLCMIRSLNQGIIHKCCINLDIRRIDIEEEPMATRNQDKMLGIADTIKILFGPYICCRKPPRTDTSMGGMSCGNIKYPEKKCYKNITWKVPNMASTISLFVSKGSVEFLKVFS